MYKSIPFFFCAMLTFCSCLQAQENTIRFELSYPRRLASEIRSWNDLLVRAGADRIRMVADVDLKLQISQQGKQLPITILVSGKINEKLQLEVKGKTFQKGNLAELKSWILDLKKKVSLAPEKQPGAFGLTPEELVAIHQVLSKPYPIATRDQPTLSVVKQVRTTTGAKINADSAVVERITADINVSDELKDVACGTVFSLSDSATWSRSDSRKQANENSGFKNSQRALANWLARQKRPGLSAPSLFEKSFIDIEGFALDKVLKAIETKTKIPFLIDQNSLARQGVELDEVLVTIPKRETFYQTRFASRCCNPNHGWLQNCG